MLNTVIVLSSAGSLSVAVIALFFFIFQGWIYLKGPLFKWSKWGALLSLASSIFALTVFIQFNSSPNLVNHIDELFQYSAFVLMVHSLYGFTFTYLEIKPRRYHQIAGAFHLILLVILWSTKLVITNEFTYRSFLWLKEPYYEP
jgi:hypothetical protein